MKICELSQKYNVSNQSIIELLTKLKIDTRIHLNKESSISDIALEKLDNYFKSIKSTKRKYLATKQSSEEKNINEENNIKNIVDKNEHKNKIIVNTVKRKVIKKKVFIKPRNHKVSEQKQQLSLSSGNDSSKLKVNSVNQVDKNIKKTSIKNNTFNKEIILNVNKNSENAKSSDKPPKKYDDWKKQKQKHSNNSLGKSERNKTKEKKLYNNNYQPRKKGNTQTNNVPKSIKAMETISIADLAKKMNIKASEIISKLISMGVMATINQVIDSETATLVASEYGCEIKTVSLYDEVKIVTEKDDPEKLQGRPPVIAVMGHVDHGKTTLLDVIRYSDIAKNEAGGITQHIGAYKVNMKSGHSLTFLDTPGHEAFTAMRARGAKITDIVILVVAVNDGLRPQTIEAINHAKDAKVPIIVALNKIDIQDSNVDYVKEQLSKYDLVPEEWGGKTIFVEISALKKKNIDQLLESIVLEAEILSLKSNPDRKAVGVVIESRIDVGKGPVATVLVQRGTLKVGDCFVSGIYSGKVRALFDDKGNNIIDATPAVPVEVLGLNGVPGAGDPFNVLEDEKQARNISQKRQELERIKKIKQVKKVTLENLSETISSQNMKVFKIILKSDVQGSIEALKDSFYKLCNDEVTVDVIHSATGAINENDIILAKASNALIIGFHVHPNGKAYLLAQKEGVEIKKYSIIYDAIESVEAIVEGMLEPELREEITGEAEIKNIFKTSKAGIISGCVIKSGKILIDNKIRIIRDGNEIFQGEISSLKRFKDDVKEVKEGFECGIGIKNYIDLNIGDRIEGFITHSIKKKLVKK